MTLLPHTAISPVVIPMESSMGPVDDEVIGSLETAVVPLEEESAGPVLVVSSGPVLDSAPEVVRSMVVLPGAVSSEVMSPSSPGHAPRAKGRVDTSRERQASEVTRALYRRVGRSLHFR